MDHIFEEIIIPYKSEQLLAWKAGDKSLIPWFLGDLDMIHNQPEYHFGEIFVLDYFHRIEGWLGFRFYGLGTWEPHIKRYAKGRAKVEELIPSDKLDDFRSERNKTEEGRKGYGEPDVFLYKETGEVMFLEVKKQGDRISENQLICLAQIREILGCKAEIIYLKEETQRYFPKQYRIQLQCPLNSL